MAEIIERLTPHLADRYRLLRVAARGGASVIIYAEDVRHERPVAVKVMSGEFTAIAGADRFLREIGILARLQHPNILPLIDSGTADGMLYYVMPFVQGESLRQRLLQQGKLPLQEALRLLREVCDALQYAHEQGLVHRDIKPENILIASRHALVADFGVARAVNPAKDQGKTTAGIAIGTPTYMSPEQAAADPQVDHRADIYALGIVAYEMLAGQPPFDSDQPAMILAAHVTQPPPPLSQFRPDLPPGLEDVIMRCLAKRPAERWESAAALGDALEPFLLPSGAVTPVGTSPVSREARRRTLAGAGIVVVILALLVALLVRDRGGGLQVGDPGRLGAGGVLELDPVISPDGRWLAYAAGANGTMRITLRPLSGGNVILPAEDVAENQRWPRYAPDGSRVAFQAGSTIYTAPLSGGGAEPLVEGRDRSPVFGFDWAPDGSQIAYVLDGAIRIRGVAAGAEPREVVSDGQAHSVSWSPDGRWLAYVSGNSDFVFSETLLGNVAPSRVMLVPAAGGTPHPVTDGRTLALSPVWVDRETLLFVQGRGGIRDVYRMRIDGRGRPRGNPVRLTTGLDLHGISLTADRRGIVYAVLSHSSNVWKLPWNSGSVAHLRDAERVTSGQQLVEDLDALPIGGYLLYDSNVAGSQDIWLLSLRTSKATQLTRDSTEEFGPTWSPTGKEIAYYAVRSNVRQVFVMRDNGKNPVQITKDTLQNHQPRWSPDGQHLVFNRTTGPGQNHIYIVSRRPDSTWSEPRRVTPDQGAGASWSPDGHWIAFTDSAGGVRIVAPEGGPSRVVATPSQTGGLRLRRPLWLVDREGEMLARSEAPGGQGGIWLITIDGRPPKEVARFDDLQRPVYRDDFTLDEEYVYFLITELQSSLWTASLVQR
jgi:serine/threonine-protein kinase